MWSSITGPLGPEHTVTDYAMTQTHLCSSQDRENGPHKIQGRHAKRGRIPTGERPADFRHHVIGFVFMGLCTALAVAAFAMLLASICPVNSTAGCPFSVVEPQSVLHQWRYSKVLRPRRLDPFGQFCNREFPETALINRLESSQTNAVTGCIFSPNVHPSRDRRLSAILVNNDAQRYVAQGPSAPARISFGPDYWPAQGDRILPWATCPFFDGAA